MKCIFEEMLLVYFPGGTRGKTQAVDRFALTEIRMTMGFVSALCEVKQPLRFGGKKI